MKKYLFVALAGLFAAGACQDGNGPEEKSGGPDENVFVLNEGQMNQNNASLDFWNAGAGVYERGLFAAANPGAVLGLGDLGNDLGVYGGKLYVVVNGSNKVEVLDVHTGKQLGTITQCSQPRYVAFGNGQAFVSAYGGGTNGNGVVLKVDTATLQVVHTIEVRKQPEGLAVVGDRLYVANSGGIAGMSDTTAYERTVTEIPLESFTGAFVNIPVAINLHRVAPDGRGNLYVSSRGNYNDVPPRLFVVDPRTRHVVDTIDVPVSNFAVAGERAYVLGMQYSAASNRMEYSYHAIDTRTRAVLDEPFISEDARREIVAPYGIAVHPVSGNIYVTDAKTYDIAGKIYCFSPSGEKIAEHGTGVIPAHIAFRTR
jgi:YVTN family beta-propeller protein